MKDAPSKSLMLSCLCEDGGQTLHSRNRSRKSCLDPTSILPLTGTSQVILLTHRVSNSVSFSPCKNCRISVDFIGGFLIHPLGRKSAHRSCTTEVREEGGGAGPRHTHRQTHGSKLPPVCGTQGRDVPWHGTLRSVHLPQARGWTPQGNKRLRESLGQKGSNCLFESNQARMGKASSEAFF